MGIPTSLLCLTAALWMGGGMGAEDNGRSFTIHEDKSALSSLATPVLVENVSARPLTCHARCVARADCLAFSLAPATGTCSLYDTFADDPDTQLQTEAGVVFFNIAPIGEKISMLLSVTSAVNGGFANFLPQLSVTSAGRVLRWQVRCQKAGVVYLAVWRGHISSAITLISSHRVDVSADKATQLVTSVVPSAEQVEVEAGDFLGFHYDTIEPAAVVYILKTATTPDGVSIGTGYRKDARSIAVGTTLSGFETDSRTAAIALYVG